MLLHISPAFLTCTPRMQQGDCQAARTGCPTGVQRNDRQPGQGHRQAAPPSHLVHQALPFDAAHALKLW